MDWETSIRKKADLAWEEIQADNIRRFSWDDFSFNYRAEHTALVYSIGMEMGKKLKADLDILEAAIILHDIGRSIVKKGHGPEGAVMAAEILQKTDFPKKKIDAVKYAIAAHVGWDDSIPESLEARILWDADKLTKLGAAIILQKSMLIPLKGKKTWDAFSEFNAWLKDAEFIKNNMKTYLGAQMAAGRFKILKNFVKALGEEMAG